MTEHRVWKSLFNYLISWIKHKEQITKQVFFVFNTILRANPGLHYSQQVPLRSCLYFAAIINNHKLGGLKQCRFILFLFWRPEIQNQSHWANVKVLAGLLSLEAPGENLFLCLLQLLEATGIPCRLWLMVPPIIFKVSRPASYSLVTLPSSIVYSLSASLLQGLLWLHLRPIQIIQHNLHILIFLTEITSSNPFFHIR